MGPADLHFPAILKEISGKYGLRGKDFSGKLKVSVQYVSKLFSGTCLPSKEQIKQITDLLQSRGVLPVEIRMLISCYAEDKTGFFFELSDQEFSAKDSLEKKLLCDFRLLSPEDKNIILAQMNTVIFSKLNKGE